MKTKLIMLDTPIIVSDEKIKEGDFCWNTYNNIYEVITEHEVKTANDYIKSGDVSKIIAGMEGFPKIDWNGLEEEFGYIDVEKLAKKATNKQMIRVFGSENKEEIEDDIQKRKYYFKEGFKKAQSLNDKKFSLEDVRKIAQAAFTIKSNNETLIEDFDKWSSNRMKSLQQPKVFDIEVDAFLEGGFHTIPTIKPKITNNSITILKKL